MRKLAVGTVVVGILIVVALFVRQQDSYDYPERSLTIIVPFAESGGTDMISRILAASLSVILDQDVAIENIVGGSGSTGMVNGIAAVPDGYTLTMLSREVLWLPALGLAQISIDDFRPLALINTEPGVVAVAENSPFYNLNDLIDEAQSQSGRIRFASAAKPHFYILEFIHEYDLVLNSMPYNGAAEAIPAVVRGEADFTIANYGELADYLASNRMRALAVMGETPIEGLEGVPTFHDLGIDIVSRTWRGIVVPRDTSEEIFQGLSAAVFQACQTPEFKERLKEARYNWDCRPSNEFSMFLHKDDDLIRSILARLNS